MAARCRCGAGAREKHDRIRDSERVTITGVEGRFRFLHNVYDALLGASSNFWLRDSRQGGEGGCGDSLIEVG